MSKQSELDEILPSLWNLLDDHFDTELLSDKCVDEINDLILNWHNKQVEALLDRLENDLPDTTLYGTSIRVKDNIRDGGYIDGVHDSRLVIEAERKRLKGDE